MLYRCMSYHEVACNDVYNWFWTPQSLKILKAGFPWDVKRSVKKAARHRDQTQFEPGFDPGTVAAYFTDFFTSLFIMINNYNVIQCNYNPHVGGYHYAC